ncbi:hypothetical protein [Stutzerimonas urumqiensis]|uniref:hypothetical protein n=1 Tax=Stutzerimonas urumqiensis TaxID=638269 RepID=UPI000EB30EE9|nr:hypothetical protein [Stutzerimonas urumqiensis]
MSDATTYSAVDMYDNATQAKEVLEWMEGISAGIHQAVAAGHHGRAKALAGLAQYLALDWADHFGRAAQETRVEQEAAQ